MTREQLAAVVAEVGIRTRTVVTAHDLRMRAVPTAAVSAAVKRGDLRREVKGIYVPAATRFRRDPGAFVATLVAEAGRRSALGIGEPAGLTLTPRGPLLR